MQRRVWPDAGCSLPEDKAALRCAALRHGRGRTAPNEQRRRCLLPLTPSFTVSHDDSRLSLPVRSGHEPFSPSQLYNLTLPVPPHFNYSPVIPRYQLVKTPTSTFLSKPPPRLSESPSSHFPKTPIAPASHVDGPKHSVSPRPARSAPPAERIAARTGEQQRQTVTAPTAGCRWPQPPPCRPRLPK